MKNIFLKSIALSLITALLWRCNGDDAMPCSQGNSTPDPELEEIRDQEILPSYEAMIFKLNTLSEAASEFSNSPTEDQLETVRAELKSAWIEWQNTSSFEFGPAEQQALRANVNTFPADSFTVVQQIESSDFSLLANDTKGFPTVDLLLNGLAESNSEIISLYQSNSSYGEYLESVISDISTRIQTVNGTWLNSYGEVFATNTGFATGSSYSLYINAYIQDWEELKRNRIALPLGLLTFEIPIVDAVECYYGGYSQELAYEHVLAHESKYLSADYSGIQELVQDITAFTGENGVTLDEAILERFSDGKQKLELVNDPLAEDIISNAEAVTEAYDALQGMVVLFKTELTSGLGISVNFSDNDGD